MVFTVTIIIIMLLNINVPFDSNGFNRLVMLVTIRYNDFITNEMKRKHIWIRDLNWISLNIKRITRSIVHTCMLIIKGLVFSIVNYMYNAIPRQRRVGTHTYTHTSIIHT